MDSACESLSIMPPLVDPTLEANYFRSLIFPLPSFQSGNELRSIPESCTMTPDLVHVTQMPQLGSFTLLLGLALSVYAFLAGLFAIVRDDDRLSETARRAGIAVFLAVTAASAVLVYAAFQNDFSVAYILHHSNPLCRLL